MIFKGDIVAYRPPKAAVALALVYRWSGNPSSVAVLIDATGKTYRPFVTSVTLVEGELADTARAAIDELLLTEAGKQTVKTIGRRATGYVDRRNRSVCRHCGGLLDHGECRDEICATHRKKFRDRAGAPDLSQEPLILAKHGGSGPDGLMLGYMRGDLRYGGEQARQDRALRRARPRHHAMLFRDPVSGEHLVRVAARMGIAMELEESRRATRQRYAKVTEKMAS